MKYGYFDSKEFASRDGAESPYGPMQVQEPLLVLLNQIREAYGKPIAVNCGYRSPDHNRAVGGVANSYHVQGLAADIRPTAENADDLPELRDICNRLNGTGGVGIYDTFVHVDARGYRARWDNRTRRS